MNAESTFDVSDQSVEKVAVVLGDFAHEGLNAKINGLGLSLVRKRLRSSANNWLKISELLRNLREQNMLATVIVYAPTPTLMHIASEQYDSIRAQLFDELELASAYVFIHEDNFVGKIEPAPWQIREYSEVELEDLDIPWADDLEVEGSETDNFGPGADYIRQAYPTREEWLHDNSSQIERTLRIFGDLQARHVSLVPFRTRSDVTLRIFEVLEDAEAGIFLRLYVPHGRYQSEQFEDFLTMFSRYLREVEGKEFSIGTDRTARGTTYVFRGRGEVINVGGLDEAISRFDKFLALAEADPKSAEIALRASGRGSTQAPFIVAKYARQNRRLTLEMRHEHDRRRLQLHQELEAELLDDQDALLLPLPDSKAPSGLFSIIGNSGAVNITMQNSPVFGAAEQVVIGDIRYTAEDNIILARMQALVDKVEAIRLRSDLDRLKDKATQPEERRTAVQRLKAFVYSTGKATIGKVVDIGTDALVKYLERQIESAGS